MGAAAISGSMVALRVDAADQVQALGGDPESRPAGGQRGGAIGVDQFVEAAATGCRPASW